MANNYHDANSPYPHTRVKGIDTTHYLTQFQYEHKP